MLFQLPGRRRQHKRPSEIIGVDLSSTGVKVVRVKKTKEGVTCLGAQILSAAALAGEEAREGRFPVPKDLLSNYAAIAVTGEEAVVRILSLQVPADGSAPDVTRVREQVGLGEEYRLGSILTTPAKGKGEGKVLVAGLPEQQAAATVQMFSVGAPAPFSLELSGLAALDAFLVGPGAAQAQGAVAVIESGARITFMALFHRGVLSLVRKFDFGAEALIARVQHQLGVDRDTALGAMSDSSFDLSQALREVMDPFLRQLSISKDFVERREDCRVTTVYLSGGSSLLRHFGREIATATGLEAQTWNPFEGLRLEAGAYPAELDGQQTRFTAAIGAAWGVLAP
jgi:Tfp pilus assembly PilM family ATPase